MSKDTKLTSIVVKQVSYRLPDGTVLFNDLSLALGNEKTGLVGKNGSGKTTLAKIIAGSINPTHGSIVYNKSIGYLPQEAMYDPEASIAHILGIDQKIAAIARIESGAGSNDDFDLAGDDWDIVQRTRNQLTQLCLDSLAITQPMKTLSGGQRTRILFARLLLQNHDYLILDEPTNHLDQQSCQAFYKAITAWNKGMLIISHDRTLLSLMDQILELSSLGLKSYGGNFQDYATQKAREKNAAQRHLFDAQKALKKIKETIQESAERQQQRAGHGKKQRAQGGQAKVLLDRAKERSEQTQGSLSTVAERQLQQAQRELAIAQAQYELSESITFDLAKTRVNRGKMVVQLHEVTFGYNEHIRLFNNINFMLVGPERVAIAGPNGSGKSTLLKLIAGKLQPTLGSIKLGVPVVRYLDQDMQLLNPHKTVLENFMINCSHLDCTTGRTILAQFLFREESVNKIVANLSGGEKMRIALACCLMTEHPVQLLLLDEPTNHMDLDSIEVLENIVRSYQGALIVVSHDQTFLKNITIEREVTVESFS